MTQEESLEIDKLKKEIVIERLRQTSPKVRVSFGGLGKFMDRDDLIEQVKNGTDIGDKIVKVQIAYMQAFKKKLLAGA